MGSHSCRSYGAGVGIGSRGFTQLSLLRSWGWTWIAWVHTAIAPTELGLDLNRVGSHGCRSYGAGVGIGSRGFTQLSLLRSWGWNWIAWVHTAGAPTELGSDSYALGYTAAAPAELWYDEFSGFHTSAAPTEL